MNLRDLIALPAVRTDDELGSHLFGLYFNHLPTVEYAFQEVRLPGYRVEVKLYNNVDFRRFHSVSVVYHDDAPVMVLQNAGREGDDYYDRWIIDKTEYGLLEKAVYEATMKPEVIEVADLDKDLPELTSFYGHTF